LIVPTEALARLIADEWSAQGEEIDLPAMPATRLAFTAIDRTAGARTAVADEIARFAAADLVCYFAEGPQSLVARQERDWGPWLAWAARELDLALVRAKGIRHQQQPTETLARAAALALADDDFALSALAYAASLYGSAILAFAVRRGDLTAEEAFRLARLDEAFQEERWGRDQEAAERTDALEGQARMIGAWFAALDAERPQAKV
jgi:chaperone required for assembly of F1-ATPase